MHERLKQIREVKKMSQSEFAKTIGMGHSTLGMMEVGKRNILDRHIKTICSLFNVDEEWLRTGQGEMFIETDETILSEFIKEYKLSPLEDELIRTFFHMPPEQRKKFNRYVKAIVDEAYQEYREDYIEKNALPFAARHGETNNLSELSELYDTATKKEGGNK